ncbi:MAG TPA: ribose-phosphate pyrophosphokinase [Gemmatirosa sp.]|nr:ribose-phosphate pyrophosphokinase [Gemmatirosa sp.]
MTTSLSLPLPVPTSDPASSHGTGFKLLSGTANRALAEEIARALGKELTKVTCSRFADGEIFVRIDENIRGSDIFIVQPTNPPAENMMEMLLLVDAARRASADRITVVMPYYGYSRQDRKDQPRVAIGAKLVANAIEAAGADRVLGIDFHQHQLQGFFDIPVDHLYARPVLVNHYRRKKLHDLVVVSPDVGAAKMARGFAKQLDASFAIIDKRRPKANVSEVLNVIGDVEGRACLIADDMIDTAGTVSEAARALIKLGAREVYVCATHALLSGPAAQRLTDAPITEVTVTDTIGIPADRRFDKLTVLSVGELLAKAIRFTHSDQSVSSLFD